MAAKRILGVREEVRTGLVERVGKRKEEGENLSFEEAEQSSDLQKPLALELRDLRFPTGPAYPSNMTLGKSFNPFEVTLFTGLQN